MTLGEKLRIIKRWTYTFDIVDVEDGKWYGRIIYSKKGLARHNTDSHSGQISVVDDAYELVREYIWFIVWNISDG